MDSHTEHFSPSLNPSRRNTISTVSSEKLPSLPSGKWPLTIHGNCTRCGHHHKAAVITISVVAGICEASHMPCERCCQRWLTIGGTNNTQLSLLSTVTTDNTDLIDRETKFRSTLVSMVRSAASIGSPTALSNVPEDPSPTPSRNSSGRAARKRSNESLSTEIRHTSGYANSPAIVTGPNTEHVQGDATIHLEPYSNRSLSNGPILATIKQKFKNTVGMLKRVQFKGLVRQSKINPKSKSEPSIEQSNLRLRLKSSEAVTLGAENGDKHVEGAGNSEQAGWTTSCGIEDLKDFDKEAIRIMTDEQRKKWIREQITIFKCRCSRDCSCKRRRSASSVGDRIGFPEYLPSPTTPSFHRFSLGEVGSQFDIPGALFTHTGPLTISATRISEAPTAVDNQSMTSSPRNSRLDFAQVYRSRSPRPTSRVHSRHSWQQLRNDITRNSMDSTLAGSTVRNSWRTPARFSNISLVAQTAPSLGDTHEIATSPEPAVREEICDRPASEGVYQP